MLWGPHSEELQGRQKEAEVRVHMMLMQLAARGRPCPGHRVSAPALGGAACVCSRPWRGPLPRWAGVQATAWLEEPNACSPLLWLMVLLPPNEQLQPVTWSLYCFPRRARKFSYMKRLSKGNDEDSVITERADPCMPTTGLLVCFHCACTRA